MLVRAKPRNLLETKHKHLIEGFLVYTKGRHWWSRLFNPLSHVSLVVKTGGQYAWLEFSSRFNDLILIPPGANWRNWLDEVEHIQPFQIWRDTKGYRVPHLLQPFTCVEQSKAYLGIRKWWILTPNQLKRYIDHGKSI